MKTDYYLDFLQYYNRAYVLQNLVNLGNMRPHYLIDDNLMCSVSIYDTVKRRHAGFSNVLEDVWFGSDAPKYFKWDKQHKEFCRRCNHLRATLTFKDWAYLFMVHRLTGSGASFEKDHGYRNSIIPYIVNFHTMEGMRKCIQGWNKPMFTSIGNQIPMFPKKSQWKPTKFKYETAGKYYICEELPKIITKLHYWLKTSDSPVGIRDVVDWLCNEHEQLGFKKFHFQFTAFAADLADYMPEHVLEGSMMYYGKNAKKAMDLLVDRKESKCKTKAAFYDFVMSMLVEDTGNFPKDLEDVLCDYIRYVENYIPESKEKTYEGLDRRSVFNNSMIKNHPVGRQRWMLNTDKWKW